MSIVNDEMKKRIQALKIGEYSNIPYVNDFTCPECGETGDGYIHVCGEGYVPKPRPILVGWCDTPSGFMKVFECPKCFTRFRYHGSTTERNNLEAFFGSIQLDLLLQDHRS